MYAFCGIGNPAAFFSSIRQSGLPLAGTSVFDDHYAYTAEDMEAIFKKALQNEATVVLCTQKDWVKTALVAPWPPSEDFIFACLAMELDFVDGFDTISQRLDNLIQTNVLKDVS